MNEEKVREIAIQILDEFEELLAAKGITIPSDDREGREEDVVTDILVEPVGGDGGACNRRELARN